MLRLLEKLGSKIVDQVLDNLASYALVAIAPIAIGVIVAVRAWLLTSFSIAFPFGVWLLVLLGVIACLALPARSLANLRRRLTNPDDIKNAINEWFSNGERQIELPVKEDRQYHFAEVDKVPGIERGSTRRYLPLLARQHNYAMHSGARTFALVKLTKANDVAFILSERIRDSVRQDKKEVEFDCSLLARRTEWPVEGVIQFFREAKMQYLLLESPGASKIDVLVKGHKAILKILEQATVFILLARMDMLDWVSETFVCSLRPERSVPSLLDRDT